MSAEEHKALVRRWFAETDKGNLEIIDELIPENYVDHNPALPMLPSGREGVREYVRILRSAFTDAIHTIHDQIAEGDKVMTRMSAQARFTGPILGYQPTGNVIEISGVTVHRIANGQLVEHWAQADMTGFMEQIAAPPDRAKVV